jgi:hypothetical protein
MAFTTTDRSVCNKLVTDFPSLINPLTLAQGTIMGHSQTMDSMLRTMAFSGTGAINNGIGILNTTVENSIPGSTMTDMESLKTFLDQCAYLNDNNPLSVILNTSKGIYGIIDDTLNSLLTTVPEFGVAQIAGYINDLLKGVLPGGDVLSSIFKSADKLIECLSTLCSAYDPSYYNPYLNDFSYQLQSLYSTMNIVDDPFALNYADFDYDALFANVGLSVPHISDMKLAIDAVDTVKSVSMSGIMDSIASVKDLLKGDFFA